MLGQNPLLGGMAYPTNNGTQNNASPNGWEYIQQLKQTGYDPYQMQQQVPQQNVAQSDPYTDFESEFSKCSSSVQGRILNDAEFKQSMLECDKIIQATVERLVRPQVMQTQEGRVAFERLLATFRNIKDKYAKEEVENMERLQKLMQDDVVKQRLAEIEKGVPASASAVGQSIGGC
jgi:hypothetical protein